MGWIAFSEPSLEFFDFFLGGEFAGRPVSSGEGARAAARFFGGMSRFFREKNLLKKKLGNVRMRSKISTRGSRKEDLPGWGEWLEGERKRLRVRKGLYRQGSWCT